MSLYNIIAPCIVQVGDVHKHYKRPTTGVEIADDVAAPLVEAGALEPQGIRAEVEAPASEPAADEPAEPEGEPVDEPAPAATRRRK